MIETSQDFAAARIRLGWSAYELALMLRLRGDRMVLKKRIHDMERDGAEIPGPTAVAVEAFLDGWRPAEER